MKLLKVFIIISGFAFFSCQSGNRNIVFDEKANQDILYGYATPEVFLSEPFAVWYDDEYSNYETNSLLVDSLTQQIADITISIVLGTWCPDSRREVPRFIKVLNSINFPLEHLTIVGINRGKTCPKANVREGEIEFVPTFIIFKKGEELGRIIESPTLSLEEDLLRILVGS